MRSDISSQKDHYGLTGVASESETQPVADSESETQPVTDSESEPDNARQPVRVRHSQ